MGLAQDLFLPGSKSLGLSGDLLAGAALQLLPVVLTTRATNPDPRRGLNYQAARLVRLTGRVAASLHTATCV